MTISSSPASPFTHAAVVVATRHRHGGPHPPHPSSLPAHPPSLLFPTTPHPLLQCTPSAKRPLRPPVAAALVRAPDVGTDARTTPTYKKNNLKGKKVRAASVSFPHATNDILPTPAHLLPSLHLTLPPLSPFGSTPTFSRQRRTHSPAFSPSRRLTSAFRQTPPSRPFLPTALLNTLSPDNLVSRRPTRNRAANLVLNWHPDDSRSGTTSEVRTPREVCEIDGRARSRREEAGSRNATIPSRLLPPHPSIPPFRLDTPLPPPPHHSLSSTRQERRHRRRSAHESPPPSSSSTTPPRALFFTPLTPPSLPPSFACVADADADILTPPYPPFRPLKPPFCLPNLPRPPHHSHPSIAVALFDTLTTDDADNVGLALRAPSDSKLPWKFI
ncbi:hypothetical protein R3P38DRAFT_3433874 [Favolaschia claudopus]|uniref:Uncharacterized protein n=1 Tax=Favolaschia claudopus TaxID=2862362 RepID=A0AAW0D2U9_9AGAR